MRKTLLITGLVLACTAARAQEPNLPQTLSLDAQHELYLQLNVKVVKEYKLYYFGDSLLQDTTLSKVVFLNEQGLRIKEQEMKPGGKIQSITRWEYDGNGNNTKRYKDPTVGGKKNYHTYSYDKNGNQIGSENIKPDGTATSKITRTYNEHNHWVTENHYYAAHNTSDVAQRKLTYNPNRQVAEYTTERKLCCGTRNGEKTTGYRRVFEYNNKGKVVKEINYDLDGELNYNVQFTYNKEGLLVTEESVFATTNYTYKTTYSYNAQGQLIEGKRFAGGEKEDHYWLTYYPNGLLKTKKMLSEEHNGVPVYAIIISKYEF